MKIAFVSPIERFGGKTGDCLQAEKTFSAILAEGYKVTHYYLHSNGMLELNKKQVGIWHDVLADCDIVHVIPLIPYTTINKLKPIKAKLVASTIFWRSLIATNISRKNYGKITRMTIREWFMHALSFVGIKILPSFTMYDLLLANSEDEIRCVNRYCLRKKGSKIFAVPNAIDNIPEWVDTIQRPNFLPTNDYILIPGVFAYRKNQKEFIKAMQTCEYPIVFMGGGHPESYLNQCKKIANKQMFFVGHIEHGSPVFWGILKYARVACLPSNCETPGIALLEAAAMGARPVAPYEGGTAQYYGWDAEYLNPAFADSMKNAVNSAWKRGRLMDFEKEKYIRLTWKVTAQKTISAYREILLKNEIR